METKYDNRMIRHFFQENKKEIEDNYFTKKVMQRLPEKKKNYDWIIVLCTALGTLIAGLLGWDTQLPAITISIPSHTTLYYLLGGIFAFPLVILLIYELLNNKRISLI